METTLELGSRINTLNEAELNKALDMHTQNWFRQFARGFKLLRFGPFTTPIAGSAFSFDGSGAGQNISTGPKEGYVWSIRRLVATGLGTGATPDIINFYRNNPSGIPVWQLNGNSFGVTFGKGEMILMPGENLSFTNSGTITATGNVTVSGDVVEVAAEQIYKLVS